MGKYAKYAIGEIILVVIGILIALQINNWNENRKQKEEEQEILNSLNEEISNNIKLLSRSIKSNKKVQVFSNKLIDSINKEQKSVSTHSLLYTFGYNTIQLKTFVLDEVLKSDRIIKSKNKEFIRQLRTLSSTHSNLSKNEYYLDDLWNNKSSVFLVNSGINVEEALTNPKQIYFRELEKYGYDKKQITALIALNKDLLKIWIASQKHVLQISEKVVTNLKR
jgi:hypothetical protein